MVASIIGHRIIPEDKKLINKIETLLLNMIKERHVTVFLFGSKSRFDGICLEIISHLKSEFNEIRRIYVRAEYPNISTDYYNYLLTIYDDTFMPERVKKAGKAAYIERNETMIDLSDICIFYFENTKDSKLNKDNVSSRISRSGGTAKAYKYAVSKCKEIINIYE